MSNTIGCPVVFHTTTALWISSMKSASPFTGMPLTSRMRSPMHQPHSAARGSTNLVTTKSWFIASPTLEPSNKPCMTIGPWLLLTANCTPSCKLISEIQPTGYLRRPRRCSLSSGARITSCTATTSPTVSDPMTWDERAAPELTGTVSLRMRYVPTKSSGPGQPAAAKAGGGIGGSEDCCCALRRKPAPSNVWPCPTPGCGTAPDRKLRAYGRADVCSNRAIPSMAADDSCATTKHKMGTKKTIAAMTTSKSRALQP
mmetsp:Transcript_95250/g.273079  ORF Transcript_95250/g.273079 Transcript_95250/m.273079 type:complete len:257 (+) Transcript_95250:205-975(+)